MNSRETVLAALEHRATPRVPLGSFAFDHDTVSRVIGHETFLRNKARSQIALWEGHRDEVAASWREDAIEFHRKLDLIDIVGVHAGASSVLPPAGYEPRPPERVDDSTWRDSEGRVFRYSPVTDDITCISDPVLDACEFKPQDFPVPESLPAPDPSCFEVVDAVIAAFRGDKFVIGPAGDEASMVLLGDNYERGLLEFILNPEAVRAAHARALAVGLLQDQWYIRPGQDAVLWGTDFSYNTGPMISPAMFREFCLPNIIQRAASVHARGLKVLKHACGNNELLLDMFLEAGYDCYQSIQASAGMNLMELRKRFAGRMALWGGVELEHLVSGTPEDVRADVRRAFEAARLSEGGFILGPSHSVAVGTKYDNFMAMLDEYTKQNARLGN